MTMKSSRPLSNSTGTSWIVPSARSHDWSVGSDGDGFLTRAEIQEGMAKLGNPMSEEELDEWMKKNVRAPSFAPWPLTGQRWRCNDQLRGVPVCYGVVTAIWSSRWGTSQPPPPRLRLRENAFT